MSHASVPDKLLHVVIVDDDELVRDTMSDWLQMAGFVISAASSFASGLALVRGSAHIDVLVTDYNLAPAVTGVQLALEARKLKPSLPVVFVTGNVAALAGDETVPGALVMAKSNGFAALPGLIQTAIAQAR